MSSWRVRRVSGTRQLAAVAGTAAVVAAMLASGGTGAAAAARPARPGHGPPYRATPACRSVGVLRTRQPHVRDQAASIFRPTGTAWPSAGSAVVRLTGAATPLRAGAPVPISELLVGSGPAAGLTATRSSRAPGTPVVVSRAGGGRSGRGCGVGARARGCRGDGGAGGGVHRPGGAWARRFGTAGDRLRGIRRGIGG